MQTPSDRLQACLAFTLQHEGGYQARENDPGNWLGGQLIGTHFGISAPALAGWLGLQGEGLSAERMQALTLAEARAIYAARYWNVVRGDDLPGGVDLMLFDFAVLAGPANSVRIAQGVQKPRQIAAVAQGLRVRLPQPYLVHGDSLGVVEAPCRPGVAQERRPGHDDCVRRHAPAGGATQLDPARDHIAGVGKMVSHPGHPCAAVPGSCGRSPWR